MAEFKEAAEKLRGLSSQVSSIVRSLSLGVLAVAWLFLAGGDDTPQVTAGVPKLPLLVIAGLCVAAIGLDLLQYTAAYRQVSEDYKAAKDSGADRVSYHEGSVRRWAYTWKIRLAVAAAASLVLVLMIAVVCSSLSMMHK